MARVQDWEDGDVFTPSFQRRIDNHPDHSEGAADMNANDELVAMAASMDSRIEDEEAEQIGQFSPVRSGAGRIRNVKQMGDVKLRALRIEMATYQLVDPEGFAAVEAEYERRYG